MSCWKIAKTLPYRGGVGVGVKGIQSLNLLSLSLNIHWPENYNQAEELNRILNVIDYRDSTLLVNKII